MPGPNPQSEIKSCLIFPWQLASHSLIVTDLLLVCCVNLLFHEQLLSHDLHKFRVPMVMEILENPGKNCCHGKSWKSLGI